MPPKTIPTTAITSGLVGDTNIANIDSQVVTMGQLCEIVNQLISNSVALNNKINSIGMSKVKIPSIKRFNGEKAKFKGFLI
jgi:hypothetical protein